MKVRVLQMVTAVAEIDRSSKLLTVRHGAYWPYGYHASCGWSSPIIPRSIDGARYVIAEHLNECPRFEWPLLPSPDCNIPRSAMPRLTARDVLPGTNLDTDERLHFGVTTDAFEVAGLHEIVNIPVIIAT